MVKASGVVFNIAKFAAARAMGFAGGDAFGSAVLAGQQISTTASIDVKSMPSAADGTFTAEVPANSTFMMVSTENTEFVRTITVVPVTTTATDLKLDVPVVACPEVAETTILSKGAGLTVDELISRGYAVFATHKLPAPPDSIPVPSTVAIAETADYDVYQFQGMHPNPVTAVKGNSSENALYGVVPKVKSDTQREIHVTITDSVTNRVFQPLTIPIRSGFFSSAMALSVQ